MTRFSRHLQEHARWVDSRKTLIEKEISSFHWCWMGHGLDTKLKAVQSPCEATSEASRHRQGDRTAQHITGTPNVFATPFRGGPDDRRPQPCASPCYGYRRLWQREMLRFDRMRCLRPIEIFGAPMLTGIWLSCARARQGVPGELVCEDISAA
jgi:hypothetical protein